ncbi:unnamed protein product [Phytophthora lilii]|uniref:Unnamed protein product n=1 Tax=Phytophthora lilii TaxID=2077276 RepID=A0A9W6X0C2_9STRA|nr:unnamed protein product [Phytophthora lilii]
MPRARTRFGRVRTRRNSGACGFVNGNFVAPIAKAAICEQEVKAIFACTLQAIPNWLASWENQQEDDCWDFIFDVANDMWALGRAVTMSYIWRWHVEQAYLDGRPKATVHEAVLRWKEAVLNAWYRYNLGHFPLTMRTAAADRVANYIMIKWNAFITTHPTSDSFEPIRVGFFDGGSRGNPGPGGSGSVVVEMTGTAQPPEVVWAAATLGSRSTTNNVVEFVGLHSLLKRAAEMHWKNLHVVGDSQMVVGLMRRRKAPKSKKMRLR